MAEFDLGKAGVKLLGELVKQLTDMDIPIPAVVYLAPGNEVAWDCEQLTLHMTRIITNYEGGDAPSPVAHALLMSSAEFVATMVRCIPVPNDNGDLPDPADVTTAAAQLLKDARAIRRGFERIDQFHLVVPRNVPVTIGPVSTQGPQGGFAAVFGTFTFQMVDADWIWDSPPGVPEVEAEAPAVMGYVKEYLNGH